MTQKIVSFTVAALLATSPLALADTPTVSTPATTVSRSRSLVGPACAVVGLYLATKLLNSVLKPDAQKEDESATEVKHVEASASADNTASEADAKVDSDDTP